MKTKSLALTLLVSAFALQSVHGFADETAGQKVDSAHDKAVTKTHKMKRKGKKVYRDNTGQHSKTEDVKDSAKNAGDDVSDHAKDLKRKVE